MEALLIYLALSAPAPLPKVPIPSKAITKEELVGKWQGTWAGEDCPTVLSPFGTYQCVYLDTNWTGSWYLDSNNALVIEAFATNDPSRRGAWLVNLKRDVKALKGKASRLDVQDRNSWNVVMQK